VKGFDLRTLGAESGAKGIRTQTYLFTQPESLILWERIQNARLALTRSVRGSEIEPAVAALADVWGQSLSLD
jgi:hypothetical protein